MPCQSKGESEINNILTATSEGKEILTVVKLLLFWRCVHAGL